MARISSSSTCAGSAIWLHCSARTLQALPGEGEAVTLAIETHVREDPDPPVRLPVGYRARNGFACCRPCRASAPRWRSRSCRPSRRPTSQAPSRLRDKATITARRRRPQGRRAGRDRIEGQGAGLQRARSGSHAPCPGALDESRAPRPVADAVSALVNLGYGQPQAAAAVAAATQAAGEGADAAKFDPAPPSRRSPNERRDLGQRRPRADRGGAHAIRPALSQPTGRRSAPRCARRRAASSPASISTPIWAAWRSVPRLWRSAAPSRKRATRGIETIVAGSPSKPDEPDQTIAVVSPCGSCREIICDYDANARVIVPNARRSGGGTDHGALAQQVYPRARAMVRKR